MDVLPCKTKEDDTDDEDETEEEQTALNNILSSKDTSLHTEYIIKIEEEIEDRSLLDTEYKIKYEYKEEHLDFEFKEEIGDFEMRVEGSYVEDNPQSRVEPKGKFCIVHLLI